MLIDILQNSPKVNNLFGLLFYKQTCCQGLSKIAQSGRTGQTPKAKLRSSKKASECRSTQATIVLHFTSK